MTSAEDVLGIARLYADARQYRKAAEVLATGLQEHPDHPRLMLEMARAQLGLGDFERAATAAYAALRVAPDDAYGMRVYALALDHLGRRQEAVGLAYRAVQADLRNYLAHYVYSLLLFNAGHTAGSWVVVQEALRLESGDPDVQFLAGRILNKLGRIGESTAAYEETIRLDPEHATAAHNIAVNRLNRGHWGRALRGFLGAARMDPALGEHVRRNIGVALTRPLRWSTVLVIVVCLLGLVSQDPAASAVPRILTGVGVAVLLAQSVWLWRMVPGSARRSVLRTQPMLAVRGVLAVCAAVNGVMAIFRVLPAASAPASVLLMLAGLMVTMYGWLSGT